MKRPMLVTGFSCLFTCVLLSRVNTAVGIGVAVASLSLFIVSVCIKKTRQALTLPTATLSAVFACILFFLFTAVYYTPAVNCCEDKTEVKAHILSVATTKGSGGTYTYTLKTHSVGGKAISRKLRLTVYNELSVDVYDNITFTGRVYTFGEDDEETGLYYKSLRLYLGAFASGDINVEKPQKHNPYYYVLMLKQKISDRIWRAMPGDNGGFLIAMLFGDKSNISQQLKDNMRTAGLSHLTAVSGLHLSAWTMLILSILEKLKLNKKLTALIGIIPIITVITFSAFSISVLRAGTMLLLYLAGRFFGESTDGLNSVGFACFVLILFNPYTVCDASFLLSVGAVSGVIICSESCIPPVTSAVRGKAPKIGGILSKIVSVAMVSLFAQLFTFPVTAYYFGTFSPYAVLANIFVSFPSVVGMYLSPVMTLISSFAFAGGALKLALSLVTSYIIKVTDIISSLPLSLVRADYPYVYISAAVAIAVYTAFFLVSGKKLKSTVITAVVSVMVLGVGCTVYYVKDSKQLRFITVDTGSGICVMLQRHGKADVIGCCGEYYAASRINDEADKRNLVIENVIIPSDECFTKSAVKKFTKTNSDVSFFSSYGVYTGLNYVKQKNLKLKPCDGLYIYSGNGYVLCYAYGTCIVIGSRLPKVNADIYITGKADENSEKCKNIIECDGTTQVVCVNENGFSIKRKGNHNGDT